MSAEVLRRLRAHRDLDAFMVLAIAFLRRQSEPVLRAEDLLQQLAAELAKDAEGQSMLDSIMVWLSTDDLRGQAGLWWLLVQAKIKQLRDRASAEGYRLIVEERMYEALRRGEPVPTGCIYRVESAALNGIRRDLLEGGADRGAS